ncbi:MAG: hypothetical protein MZU97_03470 [Bacillus subtilis]|nr:hypothetical protein [Bacillus subtilis]
MFFEELLATGGYFQAVEEAFFIDSGIYPERHGRWHLPPNQRRRRR